MKNILSKNILLLLVSIAFIAACSTKETASLSLSKDKFKQGEVISVQYVAPSNLEPKAWVGIIPSSVAHGNEAVNDQHDISYQYLNKSKGGTLTFTAPPPGSYDFRMHDTDSNGLEIATVSFTVEGSPQIAKANAKLEIPKNSFSPGEKITVNFVTPQGYASDAWVGIIPSSISHGSESVNDQHDITYQYLKNRTSGALIFLAPGAAGSYDFRMHNTDQNGTEVASVTFTVE